MAKESESKLRCDSCEPVIRNRNQVLLHTISFNVCVCVVSLTDFFPINLSSQLLY